ncbi:MAG: hypothetical protein WCJ85_06895 [Chitinophagaceae bacterium]
MNWFRFILSHSIFIAFCAVGLTLQTYQLLQVKQDWYVYGFIFFATLLSYNIYWLLSAYFYQTDNKQSILLKKEAVKLFLVCIAIPAILYCFKSVQFNMGAIIIVVLLSSLYFLPIISFRVFKFSFSMGIYKTIILALVWTLVTALLPLQKALYELNMAEVLLLGNRFMFMLLLCIIFDTRDIAIDQVRGQESLATYFTAKSLFYVVWSLVICLILLNNYYAFNGINFKQSAALQISLLGTVMGYKYSTTARGYIFYYFFIDGLMLFSALATFIASI